MLQQIECQEQDYFAAGSPDENRNGAAVKGRPQVSRTGLRSYAATVFRDYAYR